MGEVDRMEAEQAEDGELLADTPCPYCGKQVDRDGTRIYHGKTCPYCAAELWLECDEQYDEETKDAWWIYWWELLA